MPRIVECADCGKTKPHFAKGLCSACYYRQRERPLVSCADCGKIKPHKGKGLCRACYTRQRKKPLISCADCGEIKQHVAKGLCKDCYLRQWYAQKKQKQANRDFATLFPKQFVASIGLAEKGEKK